MQSLSSLHQEGEHGKQEVGGVGGVEDQFLMHFVR
jgi:hypothetical protein